MKKNLIIAINLSLVLLTGCNSNKKEQTPVIEEQPEIEVAEDTIDWAERDKENTRKILEKLQQ